MSSRVEVADELLPAFFDRSASEFTAALARGESYDHDLRFADRLIRLRFADTELEAALLQALRARLSGEESSESAEPDVTIALWQERNVLGGAMPVPWDQDDVGPRGLVRGPAGSDVLAVHEAGSGAITIFNRRARTLLHRVPDSGTLPWWERAAPLRPALFWALSEPGRHLVHAGAVGDHRGGVVLGGAGGSGKTTVALAALAAGMRYVADDYLLLHEQPEPTAWNLFGTAKLDAGHLARLSFPSETVRISSDPVVEEKFVLDVCALRAGALVPALAIRAIVLPRIRGGRTMLREASAGEALLALAPSTAFQMPYDDGAAVASLGALARAVPAFALDVGDDLDEVPAALDRVLDAAEGGVKL
jgi:hypothetical protein